MCDDCKKCIHGKPMVGVIFCEINDCIKTDTTKTCDRYEAEPKQVVFE